MQAYLDQNLYSREINSIELKIDLCLAVREHLIGVVATATTDLKNLIVSNFIAVLIH